MQKYLSSLCLVSLFSFTLSCLPLTVQAQSPDEQQELAQTGLRIAPVPLNLTGKDRTLVGLGSFLVNAVGGCDECHTNAQPPNFNYSAGANPFFGQRPAKIDPTGYLAGGSDMGTVSLPPGPPGQYSGPKIISRNLTPDKTGQPAGGMTLAQFMTIMRTDFDHQHPTCTSTQPPTPANCLPAPADGDLLQVMPWPRFQYLTDHELTAIYEYLSAIPCIEGPTDPKNPLHNDCH